MSEKTLSAQSKFKKPLFFVCVFFLLACSVSFAGYKYWDSKNAGFSKDNYREVAVKRADLELTIQATGVVQPENRLVIKPPLNGRIEEILVKEGQSVRKGDILAWMSSTDRAALLDAARAKSADELAHWEDMVKPAPLVAPMSGLVISRTVEPGQVVGTGDTAFAMSDHLIVMAQVDETDMRKVKLGQPASYSLDAYPNSLMNARVHEMAFEAKTVNNVTVYEVQVNPEKVPTFMRSGMTANVTFKIDRRDKALLIPVAAIQSNSDDTKTVLVPAVSPDSKKFEPQERTIETGLSDGKLIEVKTGLAEGELVLVQKLSQEKKQKETSPLMPSFGGGRRRPN